MVADRVRAEIGGFTDLIAEHFVRVEPRLQATKYIAACASDLDKINGWTVGEFAGDATPDKTQRLLSRAVWDEDAVMAGVRSYLIAGLEEVRARAGLRIVAVDESGQEKSGNNTAGVKRQYMGCVGKVANGINNVFVAYVREGVGHAIAGVRQWIPAGQIADRARAEELGIGEDVVFKTKGALAAEMVAELHAAGVRPDFVAGDEVYGASPDLREYCEGSGQGYILRVRKNILITLGAGAVMAGAKIVRKLLKAKRCWQLYSAGKGTKGQRNYRWAWIGTESPRHWLLIRRNIKTGECAYHLCFVPEGRHASLAVLARAAGLRWPIEETFEFGKDYFGLDRSQVRRYRSIKRHLVLVAAALAVFAVVAARLRRKTDSRVPRPVNPDDGPPVNPGLISLTINEIKRLYNRTVSRKAPTWFSDRWSVWRRRHQARAEWFHCRAQLREDVTLAQVRP